MSLHGIFKRKRANNSRTYKGMPIGAATGVHEACIEIVLRHIPKGSRILDIAAGSGAFVQRLLDCGYEVQANDLDHTKWSVQGIRPWKIDLNKDIPKKYLEHQFDVVIAMEIIEHLENPTKFLKLCKSFCRAEGRILLTTPNIVDAESYCRYIKKGCFAYFDEDSYSFLGHIGVIPYWILEQHFKRVGLEVLHRGSCGNLRLSGIRVIAPFIQRLFLTLGGGNIPKELRSGACLWYLLKKSEISESKRTKAS